MTGRWHRATGISINMATALAAPDPAYLEEVSSVVGWDRPVATTRRAHLAAPPGTFSVLLRAGVRMSDAARCCFRRRCLLPAACRAGFFV